MTRPFAVRTWPALVALGVVVLISLAMLGVDLLVDRQTAAQTSDLIDNSLKSIQLANDLRYQAYRLSQPGLDADSVTSIRVQIDADARAYDLIANGPGEAVQWEKLQGLLAHLQNDPSASEVLLSEIGQVIERLVEINQNGARESERAIAGAQRSGLYADALALVITLALAGGIALVLVRVLRRQRVLLAMHLDSLDERARDLEAFAARTAHDLKGPLNPVAGYADLLVMEGTPSVKQMAGRIRRAADRMAGVIDDLLALSVAGHPRPGTAPVAPVVQEVIEELRRELGDAMVSETVIDCVAACNASVLTQLLRNVVSNAAKYRAPDRQLALSIAAAKTDGAIEIVVADNGVGMSEDTASHAFDPYYRAPTAKAPGHGLGLAIVKRTLDAIGGTIALASTPGEGTKVTIRVPAAA